MILNLFTSQLNRRTGGIQNTSYYLAYGLADSYKTNAYCTLGQNESFSNSDIQVFSSEKLNPLFAMISNCFKYIRNLQKYKGIEKQVSLCTTWKYAIVPWIFRKRAKYVVMTHGAELLNTQMRFGRGFSQMLMRKVLNNAAVICSNSNYTASLVKEICPNKEPVVIHPLSGEKYDVYREGKSGMILSVGRLDERKGFQFVVEAVSRLVDEIPDICYYIAGDGEYKEPLEKMIADKNLSEHVKMLGRIEEDRKNTLLDETMLMVMPSYVIEEQNNVEGFGIVYIEANAHGKPAVGTYSGGIPDAIINNKTGILVEEKNVEQLTEAIRDVLTGKKVFDKEVCFDWAKKHYYTEIVECYRQVIESIDK